MTLTKMTPHAAELHTYTFELTNTEHNAERLKADDVRQAMVEAGATDVRVEENGNKLVASAEVTGDEMILQIQGKLHIIDIPDQVWEEAQQRFGVEDPTEQLQELLTQWWLRDHGSGMSG